MHGISFDTNNLKTEHEVDIYGYPFTGNPKRRLVCWHGRFMGHTAQGLLAFSYEEVGRVQVLVARLWLTRRQERFLASIVGILVGRIV